MFSIIKSFFGGIWGYVGIAVAAAGAVVSVYLSGRSAGRDAVEKDAVEALRDAEQESANDVAQAQERVDAINDNIDIDRDIN